MRRLIASSLAILALDQVSKVLVRHALRPDAYVAIAGNTLGIRLSENRGAAFGLFQSGGPVLALLTGVAIGFILYYSRRAGQMHRLMTPAFALLLGGALGNLVDRVRFGHVVDFIYVSFWPTFNLADAAITFGVALLAYCLIVAPSPESVPAGESSAAARKSRP